MTLTFLLIDDCVPYREILRKMVEAHRGWKVSAEAGDGTEGVSQAMHHNPDVALVDINLPQMNGIETARRLKQMFPNLLVITFSGHHDLEYFYASQRAGANGHFRKEELDTAFLENLINTHCVILQAMRCAPNLI